MIDLMGNVVPNDAEIESAMQDHINSVWSPSKREQVLRTGVCKADLDAFFTVMSADKAQIIADRDLLKATIAYESALIRLDKPALDPKAVDADGNLVYPLDDKGINQAIEADKAERANAQAVVDNASDEVKALAEQRKPAVIEPVEAV